MLSRPRTQQSLAAEAKFLGVLTVKGGRALDPYNMASEKVNIDCGKGHIFSATPSHVSNDGLWCKQCPNGKVSEIIKELAFYVTLRGGILLTKYNHAKEKVQIQCGFGHRWYAFAIQICKTPIWCPECNVGQGITYEDNVMNTIRYCNGKLNNEYRNDSKYKLNITCGEGHIFMMNASGVTAGNWCTACSGRSTEAHRAKFMEIVTQKGGTLLSGFEGSSSIIKLRCNLLHEWSTSSSHIVSGGTWCPHCPKSGTIEAERKFRAEVIRRNGELLTEYNGIHTYVTVRCDKGHEFTVEPNSIMSMETWCAKCSGCCSKQAAEFFYARVAELRGILHGEYSHAYGYVKIECEFGHKWDAVPHSVMARWTWCPHCNESQGERFIRLFLDNHGIAFEAQKYHPSLSGYRYDFCVTHNDKTYYIEYDGGQHFERVDFFCKSDEDFQHRRNIDILKTRTVITSGEKIIRIDHTLKDDQIEQFILASINDTSDKKLYLTNNELYKWIIDGIETKPKLTLSIIPKNEVAEVQRIRATPIMLPIGKLSPIAVPTPLQITLPVATVQPIQHASSPIINTAVIYHPLHLTLNVNK